MIAKGNVAKTLTSYLEPLELEGMSEDEFITTFCCSVLIEKSGIIALEQSSLLSGTKLINDTDDVLNPITDSSESISNKTKVFELRKRSGSLVNDIFVGRAPTNDIVLASASVSKSHLRFISIPQAKHYQLVDMFSSNGTYLNGKKINPFEKHKVEHHDEISFGGEYQLIYYSTQAFHEMLIGLKE